MLEGQRDQQLEELLNNPPGLCNGEVLWGSIAAAAHGGGGLRRSRSPTSAAPRPSCRGAPRPGPVGRARPTAASAAGIGGATTRRARQTRAWTRPARATHITTGNSSARCRLRTRRTEICRSFGRGTVRCVQRSKVRCSCVLRATMPRRPRWARGSGWDAWRVRTRGWVVFCRLVILRLRQELQGLPSR